MCEAQFTLVLPQRGIAIFGVCVCVCGGWGGGRCLQTLHEPPGSRLPAPGARPAPAARRRTPCLCANPREAAVEATEAAVETTEASVETTEGGTPLKAKKSAN